jgi:hypothetical protein
VRNYAQARQAVRDLVTAAAAVARAEESDEIEKVARINDALDRLEDEAVAALVEAGLAGDADFEAGAAFDLFFPPPGRFSCVPRPGEPSFTLLGRDSASDGLIEIWAEARRMQITLGLKPREDMAKVIEAHNVAQSMREYRVGPRQPVHMTSVRSIQEIDQTGEAT